MGAHLLLAFVPVEHPAQVAAAVAEAAPEPVVELRCSRGLDGRISSRRKVSPIQLAETAEAWSLAPASPLHSPLPVVNCGLLFSRSPSLSLSLHPPRGMQGTERVADGSCTGSFRGSRKATCSGGASQAVAERTRSNASR
jgi:hypothetical protein